MVRTNDSEAYLSEPSRRSHRQEADVFFSIHACAVLSSCPSVISLSALFCRPTFSHGWQHCWLVVAGGWVGMESFPCCTKTLRAQILLWYTWYTRPAFTHSCTLFVAPPALSFVRSLCSSASLWFPSRLLPSSPRRRRPSNLPPV